VPEDPEIKRLLQQILGALNLTGEGSVSELIREVREAIKETGESSLRDSIVDLRSTVSHEFQVLRDHLRNTGNIGRGATVPPSDADAESLRRSMSNLVDHLDEVIARLERAFVTFEEAGHGGGQGGGTNPYFEREQILSVTRILDEFRRGLLTTNEVFTQFRGVIKDQAGVVFRDMAASVMNLTLHTTNAAAQLRNLHSVLSNEITGLSTHGVFGSNVLGPMEYFLEGPKRAFEGVLFETDSFRSTLKLLHTTIQDNMISPLSMTGRSLTELSGDFHKARQDMRERFNFDSRAWMSTDAANKALYDMLEFQKRSGIKSINNDIMTASTTAQELNFLKIIATMTGQTVDQLRTQVQQNRRQQEILMGQGRMSGEELNMRSQLTAAAGARLGKENAQELMNTLSQFMAYGRDRNQILGNSNTPDDIKRLFATQGDTMERLISLNNETMRPLGANETMETRLDNFIRAYGDIRPTLERFSQMGRNNAPLQTAQYGSSIEMLSKLLIGSNVANSIKAPNAAQRETRDESVVYSFIQTMKELWREQLSPFIGLPSALTANTIAIATNTAALLAFGRSGGFANLLNSFSGTRVAGFLGGAARVAGPVLGGLGAAGVAAAEGSSTAGIIGAGVGGSGGAWGGAALGTAIAGPIGTVVGGVLGSILGGYVGQKGGSAMFGPAQANPVVPPQNESAMFVGPAHANPAVPTPQNVFGPGGAAVAAATNSTYQDSNLSLLTQIVQAGTQGNYILGQMYGELARQTGYLRGDPAGAGGRISYNGQGLGVNVPPIITGTRPSDSNPYVGAGA
jgi:hypothetical protein